MRRSWWCDGKNTEPGEGTWVFGPALLVTDWMNGEYYRPLKALASVAVKLKRLPSFLWSFALPKTCLGLCYLT